MSPLPSPQKNSGRKGWKMLVEQIDTFKLKSNEKDRSSTMEEKGQEGLMRWLGQHSEIPWRRKGKWCTVAGMLCVEDGVLAGKNHRGGG